MNTTLKEAVMIHLEYMIAKREAERYWKELGRIEGDEE
tara:strand:- start:3564 stop:3677 length:114 start_codon:yes stop_codon:yes gene_type:complete